MVFAIALAFYFLPIPEIIDDTTPERNPLGQHSGAARVKPLKRQYLLWYGVATLALYAGSQCAIGAFFINYVVEVEPRLNSASGARHLAVAHAVFTVGKFVAAFMMRFVKPRMLLMGAVSLNIIFLAAVVGTKGKAGIAMISIEFFFKSCIGPTIFSIALRGLGPQTKRGAALLVASLAGGGVQAPIVGAIADHASTRIGMTVPLAAMVLVWTFPLYLNLYKANELDAFWHSDTGREDEAEEKAFRGTPFRNPFSSGALQTRKEKKKMESKAEKPELPDEPEGPEDPEEEQGDVEANRRGTFDGWQDSCMERLNEIQYLA